VSLSFDGVPPAGAVLYVTDKAGDVFTIHMVDATGDPLNGPATVTWIAIPYSNPTLSP
jgi:hypothetical protein